MRFLLNDGVKILYLWLFKEKLLAWLDWLLELRSPNLYNPFVINI
jgi:hypothetical protein